MSLSLEIALPEKLIPVFQGEADVRGAYGGRGSGKTRSFAKMAAVIGLRYGSAGIKGQILCARQFMNSLDDSSLEECKRAIQEEPVLNAYYEIGDKYIKSNDGNISFSFAGLDRNISSIKSKGRILLCWVDEAEPVIETAWETLIPTLREEGSSWSTELWVTWNPLRKNAPVEKRFRNNSDPRVKVVEINYQDNPKFPSILERARQRDLKNNPDEYPHIWGGEYKTHMVGAYYSKHFIKVKEEKRITFVPVDPLMTVRMFCDIGGTGAKADNFVFVAAQFIGEKINVVDYYEVQGQSIEHHLDWLNRKGYGAGRAQIWLPHDGDTNDKVYDVSYASAFKKAGYSVTVIPNQGKGAAPKRIEATRNILHRVFFDENKTEGLVLALKNYHEKTDEKRSIGLGPSHDWSSHCADAFGLMAICYDKTVKEKKTYRTIQHVPGDYVTGY